MTYHTVRDMLAEILMAEEDSFSPQTRLWGAVDAVSIAKLILACERRFCITIRDERVSEFAALIDLVHHIKDLVKDGRDDYRMPSDEGREAWYYE